MSDRYTTQQLKDIVYQGGALDLMRVVESIRQAVNMPPRMTPEAAIASLKKWQPELFGPPRNKRAIPALASRELTKPGKTKGTYHAEQPLPARDRRIGSDERKSASRRKDSFRRSERFEREGFES